MFTYDNNDAKYRTCNKNYAEAFVIPQVYENLFPVSEAFKTGTIFKDLYMPYHEYKKYNC